MDIASQRPGPLVLRNLQGWQAQTFVTISVHGATEVAVVEYVTNDYRVNVLS